MLDSGMLWAVFGITFIIAFMLVGVLAERQRQKSRLARQELLQKERMMAMEKGLPLPDWDAVMLDDNGTTINSSEAHERRKEWFRLVALCLGLFFAFAGIGLLFAFNLEGADDFEDIATVGFIPLMSGFGLLLFYFLTKPRQA